MGKYLAETNQQHKIVEFKKKYEGIPAFESKLRWLDKGVLSAL